MFGDYGKELLRTGIIEAKAGHKEAAQRYLDRAIYSSSDNDVMAEAWYWMSQVVDDAVEKRKAVENCLAHDLQHARARKMLAILDGKLKADEIVDPDHLPPAPDRFARGERRSFHVSQMRRADEFLCRRSIAGVRLLHARSGDWLFLATCR